MKSANQKSSFLWVLLISAVFAVCILAVLLGGVQTYQRLALRSSLAYDSRTCTQYLATRVRQASWGDAVSAASFGDGDALVIEQEIGGVTYLTRVYCHDGWLMELFTGDTGDFSPEDGEQILPMEDMDLVSEDGLMTIILTDSGGQTRRLQLQLRGGEARP